MKVTLLVLNGALDLGLSTMMDAFNVANAMAPALGLTEPVFEIELVGAQATVQTSGGLSVPVKDRAPLRPDVVLVPALAAMRPEPLLAAIQTPEVRNAHAILKSVPETTLIGAACTGSFVLAEGGLLDGREATTSWWLAPLFRQRYPRVNLDASKLIAPAGNRVTAGAALSHLDLALWVIRCKNNALAELTSRYLIFETRNSQARFSIPEHIAHEDSIVERFEGWTNQHYAEPFSLKRAASAIGTSERTLARRVRYAIDRTPLKFVQDVRAKKALELLADRERSIEDVASEVGYANASTLRSILRSRLGVGVRELRVRA